MTKKIGGLKRASIRICIHVFMENFKVKREMAQNCNLPRWEFEPWVCRACCMRQKRHTRQFFQKSSVLNTYASGKFLDNKFSQIGLINRIINHSDKK